jgi:hypothetical protein
VFRFCLGCLLSISFGVAAAGAVLGQDKLPTKNNAQENTKEVSSVVRLNLFQPLTEPPCSYCVDQHQKDLVRPNDVVLSWIRGAHNGGAMPLRHFIAHYRVVNDTYGLFFYDPEGGYVAAYNKNYGYRFHGWRGGVMTIQSEDGTVWSALSGRAISGPQKGTQLTRTPSMVTTWGHWLMLHPESTAYDLFDGKRYVVADLPTEMNPVAVGTIGDVDDRLPRYQSVLGVEGERGQIAWSLAGLPDRACEMSQVDGQPIALFWYGPTQTGVAFKAVVDGQSLTFYADEISPRTAPFKDRETGSRWTLAGRAVDGPLRGKELAWQPSIVCRWYAWSHEYPDTAIHQSGQTADEDNDR